MTLEELANNYFAHFMKLKNTKGNYMERINTLSTEFIDEARSKALAADDDIMAEADTLQEEMNNQLTNGEANA
jgi:hypothetical protein